MRKQPAIIENRPDWENRYNAFVAKYESTGETDWTLYARPRNKIQPDGPGIDLRQSRLMFITSAGAYLPEMHEPFDAHAALGDHSIRVLPSSSDLRHIKFAHSHFDHAMVEADPQTLLPLNHLHTIVDEGGIAELSPSMVSFSGYLPDAGRLVDETLPAILKVAKKEGAEAALLVPA